MIKLSIKPYCQDCPMFKVKQDTIALTAVGEIEPVEVNTILTCENAEKCTHIEKYIKNDRKKIMSVTIIDDENLKRLNEGNTVDLEFGPLAVTIASNKWVNRMRDAGNIIEKPCYFCSDLSDKGPFYDDNYILCRDNKFDIMADTGDSFQWGCINDIKYCPYCGRRLRKE